VLWRKILKTRERRGRKDASKSPRDGDLEKSAIRVKTERDSDNETSGWEGGGEGHEKRNRLQRGTKGGRIHLSYLKKKGGGAWSREISHCS